MTYDVIGLYGVIRFRPTGPQVTYAAPSHKCKLMERVASRGAGATANSARGDKPRDSRQNKIMAAIAVAVSNALAGGAHQACANMTENEFQYGHVPWLVACTATAARDESGPGLQFAVANASLGAMVGGGANFNCM